MLLTRKTTEIEMPLRGGTRIYAHDSTTTGHGGDASPCAANIIDGVVYPHLDLIVKGVGTLHLSPAEVRALVTVIADTQYAAKFPANYCNARSVVKSL